MAISALYTAATGMQAMDQKLNIVANNLANLETVAFKSSRPNFEDLLYQTLVPPGGNNAQQEPLPYGTIIGLGVKLSGTQLDFTQGSPDVTTNPLDLSILGEGFFQVITVVDGNETTAYTRAGNFTKNANGQLVLGNSIGSRLEPPITIPQNATQVDVKPDGRVFVTEAGVQTELGQIQLARFVNPAGLKTVGRNLYLATPASGEPILGNPTEQGLGEIQAGTLERSNVDPVRELVELIKTQRAFEMNSQTIQSADQTLQTLNNLRRF
ncbi:MAG: flagellar basal-body rod protein FlgG [Phycisphaerae bacterium]|nr:flagellar basal-body rod protein FlgG [Phycisphaerae bacterium]NUQ46443.1 flagellar basal-body rod protein FlgG [Phycisphaerae bacterium]